MRETWQDFDRRTLAHSLETEAPAELPAIVAGL
jgi:hypothetical protein